MNAQLLLVVLVATFLDSLLGFIGIFSLWMQQKTLDKITYSLVSLAAGALLGGAFFHLIPESLNNLQINTVTIILLIGFLLFFLIESYFHSHLCRCKKAPFSYLTLIGDGIHNFIDGLIIAASFLVSLHLGIITTLIIMAHEAPQEIGIFGALIYGKFKRKSALIYSFLAQSTVILGGLAGVAYSSFAQIQNYLLPFAAGGFIYIASADLIPELHKQYRSYANFFKILAWLLLGVILVWAAKFV